MTLSRIRWSLLVAFSLVFVGLAWATRLNSPQREIPQPTLGVIPSSNSEELRDQKLTSAPKISPEQAFRKGVLSLKGEVDLWHTNGLIKFYRTDEGNWYMQVTKYPGVPQGGIWIRIKDDGSVERGYGF